MSLLNKINWKLEKNHKESIYDNIIIREYTNYKKVKGFIKENNGIRFESDKKYEYILDKYKDEIQQMKSYMKKYDKEENVFKIRTKLPKHKWGRIQYEEHTSLAIFHRRTRHSYCNDIYIDIDIVNSAPSIITEICKINGYEKYENLEDYVNNREKIIEEVMNYYNVTRECVKKLFLRIMMGGSYIKWVQENDVDIMNKEKLKKIDLIEDELKSIREIVYSHNDLIRRIELEKWTTDEKTKKGVFALWYQSIERIIQETMIRYLSRTRGIQFNEIIPCQDGLMILEEEWYDEILKECEKEVKEVHGINIKLKRKEFDEKIDIEEYDGFILENFDFLKTTTDFLKYLYECPEYKGKIYKEDERIYYKYNDKTRIFELVFIQDVRQEISEYILKILRDNEYLLDEKTFKKYEKKYGNEMTTILKDFKINKELYKVFNKLKCFIPIKNNKVIYIGEKDCKIYNNEVIFVDNSLYKKINGKVYKKNEIIERTEEHKFNYICDIDYIENLSEEENDFCKKYFDDIFCKNNETKNSVLNILKTTLSGIILKYLFCCVGEEGNNGKTVFFDYLLKGIMGKMMDVLNKSIMIETKTNSNLNTDCEKLDKIKLGYVNEFNENDIFNIDMIKTITGGDSMHLRTLREKETTISPTCNLFINTNQLPKSLQSYEKNKAFYDRIIVIPFNNVFVKNAKFIYELKNKLDALFSYIIQNGVIQEDNIDISEEMKSQNNKYKEDNKKESFIADYIEDKIEYVNEERIERNVLYDDFYNWCMENNIKYNKIPYGSFSKILNKDFKIKSITSNNTKYYINIKYK
jgi:hypothetical protein